MTSLEIIEVSRRLACMKKAAQTIRLELKANTCGCTTLRLVKEKPSADSSGLATISGPAAHLWADDPSIEMYAA